MIASGQDAVLVTTAAAVVMVRLGVNKGRLQLRKAERRCPSCGRALGDESCRICRRDRA